MHINYHEMRNVVVITLKSMKEYEEIKEIAKTWHRFFESYELEEYTDLYNYVIRNQDKEWNLRAKV